MTILRPSVDQWTALFSPCCSKLVAVLDRYVNIADGYIITTPKPIDPSAPARLCDSFLKYMGRICARLETERTRTRHTANPSLVNVQNNDFLVLGQTCITGSVKALGKAGTVHSWRAADVGKYISGHRRFHSTRADKSRVLKYSNNLVLFVFCSSRAKCFQSARYDKQASKALRRERNGWGTEGGE